MLHAKRFFCLLFAMMLLVQPVFAGEAASEPVQPDIRTAVKSMQSLPATISPMTPSTEEKVFLRSLTSVPLYTVTGDGIWEPVLAAALPEDVTAAHHGTFGIPSGAQRGYAYSITLQENACWEDGTAITAEDILFSVRKLFENESTAGDWLFLSGAAAIRDGKQHPGSEIVSLREAGFSSVTAAWNAGYTDFFVDTDGFWGLGNGWKAVSDRIRLRDFAMPDGLDEYFVTPAYLYRSYLMDGAISSRQQPDFIGVWSVPGKVYDMDDLGILATGEKELVLLMQKPITARTLMQKLESLFLLRSGEDADTLLSYGPYRIASADPEEILLERNHNWWGEADSRDYHRILCRKIGS